MPDVSSGGLPRPLTSFIGRERELALARRLLAGSYLVTLTGPGGSGKTRLCIALAAEVAGDYPDGVYFVPLAPVRDPGLVPSTIAQSLGLQDARDRPLMDHLISQLHDRQVLLVLDNFEHLLAGAPACGPAAAGDQCAAHPGQQPLVAAGLRRAGMPGPAARGPGSAHQAHARRAGHLRVGAPVRRSGPQRWRRTSRSPRGTRPPSRRSPAAGRAAAGHRAGRGGPRQAAAAGGDAAPSGRVAARADRWGRDLPDRQQTLRATIAWSYDLLDRGARRSSPGSVFVGGGTLEAVEDGVRPAADIGLRCAMAGPSCSTRA